MLDIQAMVDIDELDELAESIEHGEYLQELDQNQRKKYLISIYTRILELNPKHPLAETNLIHYLLEQGWSLKQDEQYSSAIQYFHRVIHLNPSKLVPRAHYRLGFLYYKQHDWLRAIEHFTRALQETKLISSNREEEHPCLTQEQLVKARIKLALASQFFSAQASEDAMSDYQKIDNPDEETFESLGELEALLQSSRECPYTVWMAGGQQDISRDQYEQLKASDELYIFQLEDTVRYAGKEALFSERDMKIILYLLKHSNESFNQHQLLIKFNFSSEDAVRKCISRIKKNFQSQLGIQPIGRTRDGYKWIKTDAGVVMENDHPFVIFT